MEPVSGMRREFPFTRTLLAEQHQASAPTETNERLDLVRTRSPETRSGSSVMLKLVDLVVKGLEADPQFA
jgi:hypothetical protein